MNIIDATKSFYSNYANFSGRATRSEFWWATFTYMLSLITISMIDENLYALFAIGTVIPALAIGWRRNNDAGFSGWWSLLPLICLYVAVQPSKQETA